MKLTKEIDNLKDLIVEVRRHLHMFPELSGEEKETRNYIKSLLEEEGIENIKTFKNHYGLQVDIVVDKKKPTIAFRADMDALPIEEKGDKPYKSKNKGVMHGCGHDGHCAVLSGFLVACNRQKNKLPFNIRGIFQPKEEVVEGGSDELIKDGVLEGVEAIFCLHMYPYLKTGEIGYKYGEMMASADMFEIEIFGKSAHGARPHEGVDAILTASLVVNSLNHIVSRKIDPLHPAVISMGTVQGGKAPNIICDYVKLTGTVRTLNDRVRQNIKEMMEDVISEICSSMGARYKFKYDFGNPELINDDKMVDVLIKAAKKYATPVDLKVPVMGGEDFANYLKAVKGAFFRLGCCNEEKNTCYPQHHPLFDIDEDSLIIGAKIFAGILKEYK